MSETTVRWPGGKGTAVCVSARATGALIDHDVGNEIRPRI
jgi:hypothetical protein